MPQKRKQRNEDPSEFLPRSPSKKCKATPATGLQASYSTTSIYVIPSIVKDLDQVTHSEIKVKPTQKSATESATKTLSGNHPAQSRLIPRSERRTARLGQKDETLLRILCDDTQSGDVKELHFRNMPHSSINWNDAGHVHKINNWRNQIYGRAGLKSKAVTMWLPDEELWFELYYQIMIAESRARGILLAKNTLVLDAFNKTFAGHFIHDHNGYETGPRAVRQNNAFASKFNRMCPKLRARLHHCVFGKSGDTFVPDITLDMLHAYKNMKDALKESGIVEESDYADHLEEWCGLFANLPGTGHITAQHEQLTMAEDDAAAVLISLSQESVKSDGEDDVLETIRDGADYNVIEDYSTLPTQYSSSPPSKHDVTWSPTEQFSFSASTTSSHQSDTPETPPHHQSFRPTDLDSHCDYARSVTPVCELDITSLIASPD